VRVSTVALLLIASLTMAMPAHAQSATPTGVPAGETPTDVLFILDSSASMSRDDKRGRASDPQGLRRSAVRAFIALATPRMRIGMLNLSDGYSGNDGLDKATALETGVVQGLTEASPQGKAQLLQAVDEIKTTHEAGLDDGFTYMSRALDLADRVIGKSSTPQRYLIVLTDGDVTGEDPRAWWAQARALQASGVKVVVFRLGRREPAGLTNDELARLNDQLAPGGGGARVIERPEDMLGYYLQTFVALHRSTFVNALGQLPGDEAPFMEIQPWMDVTDAFILLPREGAAEGSALGRLVSEKLGRDVAPDLKGGLISDPNLEVVQLSRERLGALDGVWRIALKSPVHGVQLVIRSRIGIAPDLVLQPKGAEQAVLSVAVPDGQVPIPGKGIVVRGPDGDEPRPLLLGGLGADRYSGTVRPDRDGFYRVRVTSQVQAGQATARRDLPPWLEKAFPVVTAEQIAQGAVGLGAERVTTESLLKAGQPLQVKVNAGGPCQAQNVALRVDAAYPVPPAGVPARETNAPAQLLGPAPGGGLLYGFVPQAPGSVSFVLDHALAKCAGVEGLVGLAAGGSKPQSQSFDVDVERLLKIERDTPRALGSIPAGVDTVDVQLKYDIASYRSERIALAVQGLNGAAPVTPLVELASRNGAERPSPRQGPVSVKVKLPGPMPGGAKANFALVAQRVEDGGRTTEIGRFDYGFEVLPGVLGARISRDPQLTRDGVTLTLGIDPSRLVVIPPASGQDFEITVEGLNNARLEPRVLRAPPTKNVLEQTVFLQTNEICNQMGSFKFTLGIKPLPSPNGEVLVAGAPIEVAIPLPKMEVRLSAPERIGPLRPGVALPITLQSTSLCQESLRLKVSDPKSPDRFLESGLSSPNFQLPAAEGEVRTEQIQPERPAARGEAGTLKLEAIRLGGHGSTTYPAPMTLHYYTPLWTEEFPREARIAFGSIALLGTTLLALPRVLFADPIRQHREGDSSVVSGRKRFRWFTFSLLCSLAAAFAIVFGAMARWLP
jgi:hypothetical protein